MIEEVIVGLTILKPHFTSLIMERYDTAYIVSLIYRPTGICEAHALRLR